MLFTINCYWRREKGQKICLDREDLSQWEESLYKASLLELEKFCNITQKEICPQKSFPFVCPVCKNEEAGKWMRLTQIQILTWGLCSSCQFWARLVSTRDNPTHVVADSTHYVIGNEAKKGGFRGFGGRRFVIEFFDGRVITTTNLWCQDNIPQWAREYLPNNAKFRRT